MVARKRVVLVAPIPRAGEIHYINGPETSTAAPHGGAGDWS